MKTANGSVHLAQPNWPSGSLPPELRIPASSIRPQNATGTETWGWCPVKMSHLSHLISGAGAMGDEECGWVSNIILVEGHGVLKTLKILEGTGKCMKIQREAKDLNKHFSRKAAGIANKHMKK